MWVCVLLASSALGYAIILLFLRRPWQFFLMISAGWLVGYMVGGYILFVSTFFFPLTTFHVSVFLTVEILIVSAIMLYLRKTVGQSVFALDFEGATDFYFALLVVGVVSAFALSDIYGSMPATAPARALGVFESELGLIKSVMNGVNKERRYMFAFGDPALLNATYARPVAPLLLIAACGALGGDYGDVSFVVCFFNVLATAAIMYYIALRFTSHRFASVLCFMFHGGWACVNYFWASVDSDLINDVHRTRKVPFFQIMGHFLVLAKSHSISVPLAMLALLQLQDPRMQPKKMLIAGLVAALIPETIVSISVFAVATCFPDSMSTFLPFAVTLLPRLVSLRVSIVPIWSEWQMDGVFFSQLITCFEAFGPLLFGVFHAQKNKHSWHIFLATLAVFVGLCFVREGNDYELNALAIEAVFLPHLCMSFVKVFSRLRSRVPSSQLRGFFAFLSISLIGLQVVGGCLSIYRSSRSDTRYIDPGTFKCAGRHIAEIPSRGTILCRDCRLPQYFGKNVVLADWKQSWRRGGFVDKQIAIMRELESTDDPVAVMSQYHIDFLFDDRNNSLIPAEYGSMSRLTQLTADYCRTQLYQLA